MGAATSSDKTATVTLPSDERIEIVRAFDAPRHLVFAAWTTPELVARWWHANRGTVTEVKIDLRVGGRWRYAMVANDGVDVAFHGEYREIVSGERLVSTEVYEGVPEGVTEAQATTINTATFAEENGRTTVTLLIEASSKVARDAILESGMEDGLQDALRLLEDVALSIA
jgi:uncharacterized protein YndB with AHSA1/START domain